MQINRTQNSTPERRFFSEDLERYEQQKLAWILYHPNATPREYQKAILEIARRCGV